MVVDRMMRVSGHIEVPAGIELICRDPLSCGFLHSGGGEALSFSAPCSLRSLRIVETDSGDRSKSEDGAFISVAGSKISKSYGERVVLDDVYISGTRCRAALLLYNIKGPVVSRIRIEHCWGQGLHIVGVREGRFVGIYTKDIGNIDREGSRLGSGIAIFSENNPGKRPASWYRSENDCATTELTFSDCRLTACTDTAFYIHDYEGGGGISSICVDDLTIDGAGKDGFKARLGVSDLALTSLNISRVGLRGMSIEGARNVSVERLHIERVGQSDLGFLGGYRDAVYDITAIPISTVPTGLLVLDSSDVCVNGVIERVRTNPSGRYGFGAWIKNSTNVSADLHIALAEGGEVRVD